MIPVSAGGDADDNASNNGDIRSSSSRSNSNINQTLLKEATLSCSSPATTASSSSSSSSSPFATHLERIGGKKSSSSAQSGDQDDDTLLLPLLIKKRTSTSPELAPLSHHSVITTLTRNNLTSNGNNNYNHNNNNRVHVDDNYNYQQQQHHTTISSEEEEEQQQQKHQLNNNHHHYYNQQQQQQLYNTGDSDSYQQQEEHHHHYQQHPGDLSESLSSLYLPTLSRQLGTTIMSGLNWINQIDFNNLLQSLAFNPSNIFRRRNSATPIITKAAQNGAATTSATLASPLTSGGLSSNSAAAGAAGAPPHLQPYSSSTLQTKLVAKMLNGTLLKQRLLQQQSEETIELESFGVVELDNDESGIGHDFQRYENDKPTWCDACAEFLTPPVMNDDSGKSSNVADNCEASSTTATATAAAENNISEGGGKTSSTAETTTTTTTTSSSTSAPVAVQTDHLMRTYLQCRRCAYVCHLKCTPIIRINCRPAVSAVASGSPPANYRRRSNPNISRRSQRLQRNSVRFDGGSLFPEAKPLPPPPTELLVKEEETTSANHESMTDDHEENAALPAQNAASSNNNNSNSALSSPEDLSTSSSRGFEEDGGYPLSTSVTMSSIATEDDLQGASSLPTDTASLYVDSRTLEGGEGGGGVTVDEDATLCEEESSSAESSTAELPPLNSNGDNVTYALPPHSAAAPVQQVDSRTYTKKMQQQQSVSKSQQPAASSSAAAAAAELLTPTNVAELKAKILRYNERIRGKGSGLGITLIDEPRQLFRGFLRVHMNLTRPINVIAGKRPPSIYDIINEEEGNNNNNNLNNPNSPNNPNNLNQQQQQQRRTLTSFYMPRDTVKNIHITSESTSLQVIKAMLKKFKVVDNPQKFALYLRRRFPDEELQQQQQQQEGKEVNSSLKSPPSSASTKSPAETPGNRLEQAIFSNFLTPAASNDVSSGNQQQQPSYEHSLKRLADQERPLVLQLEFDSLLYGAVDIVLQENDNADIAWDAFEAPELCNFLKILDREEAEHLEHVRSHYLELGRVMRALVELEERNSCRPVDIPHPSRASAHPVPSNSSSGGGGGAAAAVVPVGS